MKILVFSDSHGSVSNMVDVLNLCKSDTSLVVHLGDTTTDFRALKSHFPDIPYVAVKGNNDFFDVDLDNECIYNFEGLKCFFTHGHKYAVKSGIELLQKKASDVFADLVFFGHTHTPLCYKNNGKTYINPGTIRQSGFCLPTFAIVQIKDKKVLSADILSFDIINKKIDFMRNVNGIYPK